MGKLFIIPAAQAHVAAILRRGPSAWFHLIRWDTLHDQFMHGAWVKGRIYEESCDLSPDGGLFIYAIHQGSRGGTEFTHAWTALSRFPWLSALAVWPQGTTYGGGGRFVGPRKLELRAVWHDPLRTLGPPLTDIKIVNASPEPHRSAGVVPYADWSGQDYEGNVIFTKGDLVFRQTRGRDQLIADFSDLKPDPQPAPEWATRPMATTTHDQHRRRT